MTLISLRTAKGTTRARKLRREMSRAETLLWRHLRARGFGNVKFRRQVPLGDFVADFLCARASLIVEVDGGQHFERAAADARRSAWMQSQGYRVIRFWNHEVLQNRGSVVGDRAGGEGTLTPTLSLKGEGEKQL